MNYGTIIDNQLQLASNWMILHGAMVTNPKAEQFAHSTRSARIASTFQHGLIPISR